MYSFSNKRDRTQLAVGVSKPYTYILGGRIAELRGKTGDAQRLYDAAICITMPEYMQMKKLVCITIYEAYMLLDIAHLNALLGKKKAVYGIYALLLRYCEKSNVEKNFCIKCYKNFFEIHNVLSPLNKYCI